MSKIEVEGWKKFTIGTFFTAYLSKDDIQPKNIKEGNVPLVSSGKENNGIIAFIDDKQAKLWNANTITVDMFGKAFYQPIPYHCVSHGRVNILEPIVNINVYCLKYIASVIEYIASKKYAFNEMCTGTKLLHDEIMLPVDKNGEPDWAYMENYMKGIETKVNDSLTKLQQAIYIRK